ncbi:MAG: methyltransferase domain-containing protein [Deltaproteobacteria bacterium]|nr:methyltransferase domain-containing protein [Deltaproteobacteria bacterium]
MNLYFPETLEPLLKSYLKETFGNKSLDYFASGVGPLSTWFTEERGDIPHHYYNQPKLRSGYLLYFLPINFAKTAFVLNQIPAAEVLPKHLKVLDLGSGPGSAGLAALHWARNYGYTIEDITCVDWSPQALQDARQLLQGLAKPATPTLHTVRGNLQEVRVKGRFHLILLSHVLNEFKTPALKLKFVLRVLEANLEENGLLVLIEPALRQTTRDLMQVRDQLLKEHGYGWQALAPCLHNKPCPMLAATRGDWCHFYVPWQEPAYLKQVDRIVGNDNRFLKVSYLILANHHLSLRGQQRPSVIARSSGPLSLRAQQGAAIPSLKQKRLLHPAGFAMTENKRLAMTERPDLPRNDTEALVVSNQMKTRGKTEVLVCNAAGLTRVSRLDKDQSEENEDLGRIYRGDWVEVPGLKNQPYWVDQLLRLGKDGAIRKKTRRT